MLLHRYRSMRIPRTERRSFASSSSGAEGIAPVVLERSGGRASRYRVSYGAAFGMAVAPRRDRPQEEVIQNGGVGASYVESRSKVLGETVHPSEVELGYEVVFEGFFIIVGEPSASGFRVPQNVSLFLCGCRT